MHFPTAVMICICRLQQEQGDSRAGEEEDLASILAEGVAKALLHSHLGVASPNKCLQVDLHYGMKPLHLLLQHDPLTY